MGSLDQLQAFERFTKDCLSHEDSLLKAEAESTIELVGAVPETQGDVSDGYHTFNELYEHRFVLFIELCSWIKSNGLGPEVWKSKLQSDGTMYPGWFIAGIGTEAGKQITYHLPLSKWDECEDMDTFEIAPVWDGHTPSDVLTRLREL